MFEKEMLKLKKLYEKGTFNFEMYHEKITDSDQFDSYDKFQNIQFSYKDDIRKTGPFERTPVGRDEVFGLFSSSGTTGAKTYYVFSKEDKIVHEEFVKTFYTELGVVSKDLGAVCAPVDTGVMAHTMMWQFTTMGAGYVNCPIPSPDNIADIVSNIPVTIVATRPDIATGVTFDPVLKDKVGNSTVKKLLMGGSLMSQARREILEKTWKADVYNMFGMSEMFGPMAGECRYKDGQHYMSNHLFIEIIDPETKKPVNPGEIGVAVYTSLWKKGFPLLRYWTDDMMRIDSSKCKCGSEMPRLYFYGRLSDSIMLSERNSNGRARYVFPVMLENIIMPYGIMEYKVIKKDTKLTVLLENERESLDLSKMEAAIINLFEVSEDAVKFEYVSNGELNYQGHEKGKRFFDEV